MATMYEHWRADRRAARCKPFVPSTREPPLTAEQKAEASLQTELRAWKKFPHETIAERNREWYHRLHQGAWRIS